MLETSEWWSHEATLSEDVAVQVGHFCLLSLATDLVYQDKFGIVYQDCVHFLVSNLCFDNIIDI